MPTYLRLLSFSGNIRKFLILFLLTSLIASVFGVLNLVLLKPLLDVLFGQVESDTLKKMAILPTNFNPIAYFNYYFAHFLDTKGKLGALRFVCTAIITATVIGNTFRYLSLRLLETFKASMVANLRQAVFQKTLSFQLSFFHNERKGNLISRIVTDVQEVENSIANTFSAAIKELLLLIGYLIALFSISTKLTLFSLVVVPITGIFLGIVLKRMRQEASDTQTRLSNLISVMDEAFGGIRVIKAFVAEKYISKKFIDENSAYQKAVVNYAARRELANPFSEVIGISMVASLLLYGGSLILANDSSLSASLFIAYIALFSQVVRPAKEIAQAISASQRGITSGKRVLELLETSASITDLPNAKAIEQFENTIEFRNVSFAYEPIHPILHSVSFSIKKGQTVALVGVSGSGKSTIADLLPRFYDPTEGEILIDEIAINTLTQASLRSLMGIVTQEPILFNDTISANVSFGRKTTQEQIEAACRNAHAHEFIMQQPQGYQTVIGDRGTKLSGGQRQRLSIARAILQNPPILILDEATSALDSESERLVQEALAQITQNRTTLVIAHRLSTIQKANKIVVVRHGKIVEEGTHQQLFGMENGIYRKLVEMQQGIIL